MENFKALLIAQKDALEKDIELMVAEIDKMEIELEYCKDKKSQAKSALRSIEKKLSKLTN